MEKAQSETTSNPGELPEELRPAARSLIKALADNNGLTHAFADFCAKAYVKPDWAGPASEFIVDQFENREVELASMARIPDLIIELASGHQTLTTTVAFQWASSSDTARMAKLAEALVATQSKIQSTEVVHLMLALATSLAITRYTRAEQLLTLAEPQAQDEHQESLAEARHWLASGRILRGCSQETRDLFDHRLRRRRTAWSWEGPAENSALQELADHLHPEQEGSDLFRAIVPPEWWESAIHRANEIARIEAQQPEPEAPPTAPSFTFPEVTPMKTIFPPEPPPVIVWNAWPFFAGGLVGAAALALVIWISPYELKKSVPTSADPDIAIPVIADATPPPQETWRKEEAARVAGVSADLQDLHARIRSSQWADVEGLISGTTADLPKEDARYIRLLSWLHLDPPDDPEIRRRLPALLAAAQPDSVTLDLWEKLGYKGSPMEEAIRNSARRQIYDNDAAWSASQKERLNGLGWPPAP
jgi:hypothetical protein